MSSCRTGVTLEICAADIASVQAAKAGGATRVELCSGLGDGGLTPSIGFIRRAVSEGIRVNVLIRPRPGDFLYSDTEMELMLNDIAAAHQAGAHGVVVGALTPEGEIDIDRCRAMLHSAGSEMDTTFHRAFDLCRDPFSALEQLKRLGFRRVLTSGTASTALEGADMLRRLVTASEGAISIMAGAGVTTANAAELVRLTGVRELHASAKIRQPSAMQWRRSGVAMGNDSADEYSRYTSSMNEIKAIVEAISTKI